jgi:hypothetical protein
MQFKLSAIWSSTFFRECHTLYISFPQYLIYRVIANQCPVAGDAVFMCSARVPRNAQAVSPNLHPPGHSKRVCHTTELHLNHLLILSVRSAKQYSQHHSLFCFFPALTDCMTVIMAKQTRKFGIPRW